MHAIRLKFLLLLGIALLASGASVVALAQSPRSAAAGPAAQAEALVQRARDEGAQYINTNDRKARDAARKDLDEAERLARAEAKRNPACEACIEVQAAVYFFRSFFKFEDQYEDCVEISKKGLDQFPQNARLAYLNGYAHYMRNEPREAAASFKRFAALSPNDPQSEQIRLLINDSQQKFLNGWYNQANFYQTNESRIVSFNAQTLRNELVFQITPEYELQLGQMGFAQISQTAPAANDTEAVAFLQQLVQRLTQKTPGPAFPYQITVINSPDINAVTPPGYIVVYAGLLRFVDTEAQLAGVLAHELAHNYGHHPARRLIKAYHAQQVKATIAQAVNPQSLAAQAITQLTTSIGVDLFLRAYSRFEEQEADYYGAHLMFNGGYNPTALTSFFLKLYEASPRQSPKFVSTHPPHPDRINNLTTYLEPFPLDRELVIDSSEAFKKLKARYPSAPQVTPRPVPGIPGLPGPAPNPSTSPVPAGRPSPPAPPAPAPPPMPAPSDAGAPPPRVPTTTGAPSTPSTAGGAFPPATGEGPGRMPALVGSGAATPPPPPNAAGAPSPGLRPIIPPATPPPTPMAAPATPAGALSLGIFGPRSGALEVSFRQVGETIQGLLRRAPAGWPSQVRIGDVIFVNGLRDGNSALGAFINVPQNGECPALTPKFSTAAIEFTGDILTLSTNELKYSATTCEWLTTSERRIDVWYRINPGAR